MCLCCQGDAGRHGVPGEKGPNGLPVRITINYSAQICFFNLLNIHLGDNLFVLFNQCF